MPAIMTCNDCRVMIAWSVPRVFLPFTHFDPVFALDGVRIRRNSKHESCRSISYLSIAIWITWIGGSMSEISSERYDVANLTSIPSWLTFFLDEARFRTNSKQESCRYTSYLSISIWITWIGGSMSEIWSERYDVAKLSDFSLFRFPCHVRTTMVFPLHLYHNNFFVTKHLWFSF